MVAGSEYGLWVLVRWPDWVTWFLVLPGQLVSNSEMAVAVCNLIAGMVTGYVLVRC